MKAKAKYLYGRSEIAKSLAQAVSSLDELHDDSLDGNITRSELEARIQDLVDSLQELSEDLKELK